MTVSRHVLTASGTAAAGAFARQAPEVKEYRQAEAGKKHMRYEKQNNGVMNVLRITECGQASEISSVVCATPLLGLLSACLLLSGCSKDRTETLGDQRSEITAQASVGEGPGVEVSSKAPIDGQQELTFSFARCDAIVSGSYAEAFTGVRTKGTGATALSFTPKQYYLPNDRKTKIAGWYPTATSYVNNRVSWSVDGSQDVMIAKAVEGSQTSAMPAFSFTHALTQLQLFCHAEEGAAAKWGKITAIELQGAQNVCTYDLTTGGVTFSSDGNNISVPGLTAAALPEGNADAAKQFGAAVMVAPLSSIQPLSLLFHTELRGDVSVAVPARAYAAGQAAKITVYFSGNGTLVVDPTIIIEDWILSGYLDSSYPYVNSGHTIVVKDNFGGADEAEYPRHSAWSATPSHSEDYYSLNASGFNTISKRFRVASKSVHTMLSYITDACSDYGETPEDKGFWRVPTALELKVIIDKIAGLTAAFVDFEQGRKYTSITNFSGNSLLWGWSTTDGWVTFKQSTSPLYTICIRDLDLKKVPLPQIIMGKGFLLESPWGEADPILYPLHDPWERTVSHSESAWDANNSGSNTVSSIFEVASAVTKSVNAAGAADACLSYSQYPYDQGQWRVPTVRELKVIYDRKDELTGVGTLNQVYMAATTNPAGDQTWRVNFKDGSTYTYQNSNSLPVLCVRDKPHIETYPYSSGNLVVCNEVFGQVTQLSHDKWESTPPHSEFDFNSNESGYNIAPLFFEVASEDYSSTVSFEDAKKVCTSGWRLPNAIELYCLATCSIQLEEPLTERQSYWSATEYEEFDDGAWCGSCYSGRILMDVFDKNVECYVRCIRDID